MKYPVGTQFTRRQHKKIGRVETVIDYHTTTNLAGEVVRERYVTSRRLMGKLIIDRDVVQTTIDMAEIL